MSFYDTLNAWGCTSWYQLHNNAKDQVTKNVGTINGSLIPYKLQDNNIAGYFAGSTYLTNLTSLPSQSFTISVWIMQTTSAVTGVVNTIYDSSNLDETIYTRLQIDSSNILSFVCNNGTSVLTVSYPTAIINNVWYHIILRHTDGGVARFYINGIYISGSGAIILDLVNQTYNSVGAYNNNTNKFTGCMKNLFIFNTSITVEQIKKLYYMTYIK